MPEAHEHKWPKLVAEKDVIAKALAVHADLICLAESVEALSLNSWSDKAYFDGQVLAYRVAVSKVEALTKGV